MLIYKSVSLTKGEKYDDSSKLWSELADSLTISENKHSVPLYAAFEPIDSDCERADKNVKYMTALVIDYDNEKGDNQTDYHDIVDELQEYEFYIHSTHSNMMNKNGNIRQRFRLIMPFSRPVAPEEWQFVWKGFHNMMKNDPNIDTTCKSKSRSYYIPSCPSALQNQAFKYINNVDNRIEPDELMQYVKEHEKTAFREERMINATSNDIDEVKEALRFVDSSDYATWIQVLMALKDEFEDEGFEIFNEWSKQPTELQLKSNMKVNPQYPGKVELRRKWRSFNSIGITINTLFHIALLNGWSRPTYGDTEQNQALLNYMVENNPIIKRMQLGKKQVEEQATNVTIVEDEEPAKKDALIVNYNAPGLVGEIAEWITKGAVKPQPALSLAVALVGVGCVMGKKFASPTDLRTNILALCLSPSGTGKDYPRKAMKKLMYLAGHEDKIGESAATSGTAILKSLMRGNGTKAFFMDEIGYLIKAVNGRNSSSAEQEFMKNTLELFSSANDTYLGKAMANEDSVKIDQPCMGLWGSTVKHKLFQGISSSEAADGFLSRFLVFEGNINAKRNKQAGSIKVPDALVEKLQVINEVAELRTVPYSPEAEALIDEFVDYCDMQTIKEIKAMSGLEALWTRAVEHAIKVSLVCHDVKSGVIDLKVMRWSIDFVKVMVQNQIDSLKDNLYDNEQEREIKKVLEIIKNADGWIGKSAITNQTLTIPQKRRSEILLDLVESGRVEQMNEKVEGRGRPPVKYRYVER